MAFQVEMKNGNIYLTKAMEIINDDKDVRLMDIDGDYVLLSISEIDRISIIVRIAGNTVQYTK